MVSEPNCADKRTENVHDPQAQVLGSHKPVYIVKQIPLNNFLCQGLPKGLKNAKSFNLKAKQWIYDTYICLSINKNKNCPTSFDIRYIIKQGDKQGDKQIPVPDS